MTNDNLRHWAILAPHTFLVGELTSVHPEQVTNLIHRAKSPEEAWIEEATRQVGEWRTLSRSTYLRWAITINACEVAENRYRNIGPETGLRTNTLRVVNGRPEQVPLAIWPGPEAADHYLSTKSLVAAYGVGDLYGAIEDILFDFAEIYYRHNPKNLMQGSEPEIRALRRQWHRRGDDPAAAAAWASAWAERFDKWRRQKIYDGLPRLLRNLYSAAGLKTPSRFKQTTVETWAETLGMIALLRHHIVHGMPTVTAELANLSNRPTSLTFDFTEGAPLKVALHHLQSVECFIDQLLSAVNLSLLEKAIGPLRP